MGKPSFENKYIDDIKEDPESNYFTRVWDDVCKIIDFKSLLDVGCGNGVFSINVKKKKKCSLFGIDGNEYALEKAKALGFDEVRYIRDFNAELLA